MNILSGIVDDLILLNPGQKLLGQMLAAGLLVHCGFYFDLDVTGLKNLDDLLNHQIIFPIDTNIYFFMKYKNKFHLIIYLLCIYQANKF